MSIAEKIAIVSEITTKINTTTTMMLVDYSKLTVAQTKQLRIELKAINADYKVYKNTLIDLAFKQINLQQLNTHLTGHTAMITGNDSISIAKIIAKYF